MTFKAPIKSQVRFNHMELTFPPGTLTETFRKDVDSFFVDVLGWESHETELFGMSCHLLVPDPEQWLLLAESEKYMRSPGYDHLGLLYETREEVDGLLAICQKWAADDDRMQVEVREDGVLTDYTVHPFYFRWLLPIQFDVQCFEWAGGAKPTPRWRYE